ncbi:GNAT family N-acetyltransferase [Nocardia thailandica]|uniref:GNAT family N-acetyltransferase n=1 Tax=Nocardia thailandica TaxID=257275 RepID=UPI0005B8ACE6|nr:N-acetyltransferase [Nocardia thailandica]
MIEQYKVARLREDHYINMFDCGEPSMDDWLVKHAFADQEAGISATHVWEQEGGMVFGYFTLVPTIVGEEDGPFWKKLKPRSFPRQQAPGVLIGKIALDQQLRGQGLGEWLFAEAFVLAIDAMQIIGGVFLVIEPMDGRPKLRAMYEKFGFRTLDGTNRMYMEVKDFMQGTPF